MLNSGTVYVLLLTAAALTTLGLAGYAWRHRDQPGAVQFAAAMVAVTFWSVTETLALTQIGAAHLVWERVQWLAIALVPLLLFLFIADYTGYESVLSRRAVPLLFVIPVLTVVLAWTNPAHHLMWTDTRSIATSGIVTLDLQFGPWFWLYFAYAYTLLIIGFVLLLRLVVVSEFLYFDQSALIVIGIITPLAGNAISVFEMSPLPGLDLTPLGFTILGVAFGNAIFRYQLFDLLPATRQLGRQSALAALDDGVIIVGDEQEILYLNDAAAEMFDCDPEESFGESLETILGTDELDFGSEDAFAEIAMGTRTYEVKTAPIADQHDRVIGHTILLHDVMTREQREQTLRRQRNELAQLERLNRVIRSVNSALVSATTRDEIAREICETLVSDGPYETAWFGAAASTDGPVGMTADEDGTRPLDSTDELPDQLTDPGSTVNDDSLAVPGESTPTSRADGGAWVTVPLVHGRTIYGTLVLQSGRDTGFGKRELDVLTELGEIVGNAIHAVEQRQLLVADAMVELEFRSTDPGALLVRLSEELGACTLDGLVPGEAGTLLAYVTVSDATAEDVSAAIADGDDGSEVRAIDENGSTTVEISLNEGSLCCPLVEYGANVRTAEASEGSCHLVAEVSPDSDIRTVVERVTDAYPDTELKSKREVAPTESRDGALQTEEADDLTDRQREALEAAYRAGYFDWPRESTAEEVADSLDITSATLHSHLRKAENRLLSEFFEQE